MRKRFIITFGQKYRRETHPTFAKAHPDGWVVVVADDDMQARLEVIHRIGREWAFLYSSAEFEALTRPVAPLRQLYPRGELDLWVAPETSEELVRDEVGAVDSGS